MALKFFTTFSQLSLIPKSHLQRLLSPLSIMSRHAGGSIAGRCLYLVSFGLQEVKVGKRPQKSAVAV
jgi:hypothetical protein